MTRKSLSIRLIWVAIVALLLGGAYMIVARNGPVGSSDGPAGYVH